MANYFEHLVPWKLPLFGAGGVFVVIVIWDASIGWSVFKWTWQVLENATRDVNDDFLNYL